MGVCVRKGGLYCGCQQASFAFYVRARTLIKMVTRLPQCDDSLYEQVVLLILNPLLYAGRLW